MDKPKNVRVRIPCVVDRNGCWKSLEWSEGCALKDFHHDDFRVYGGDSVPETLYWIEADVPLPEPQTVQGTVSHA